MKLIQKPKIGEYAPYSSIYIDLLPDDGLVLTHLQTNLQETINFVRSFSEKMLTSRHAEGEWSIKEILAHINDDERIFCYRALRFARNDTTELPGFEQDDYVPYSRANERDIEEIIEEFISIRKATVTLFNSFDDAALLRQGVGSRNDLSVRAAVYHIAGHELLHVQSITENYLPSVSKSE